MTPFWPMIMITGKGAQESMDFHAYCSRIMHFTIPKGAVSIEQREGRINRYDSLFVKRRAATLMPKESSIKNAFLRLEGNKGQSNEYRMNDLYPHWWVPQTDKNEVNFERLLAFWPFTYERKSWDEMIKMLNTYRSIMGTIESHQKIAELAKEMGLDVKEIILDLSAKYSC